MTILAVLTVVLTGLAWYNYEQLQSSIAKAGGLSLADGQDGAVDILLVGTDSRTDAHGNPLSFEELSMLRAGEEIASNTDTIILIRIPNDGSSATAISIPRDSYVTAPQIGKTKINGVYGETKETKRLELVKSGRTDSDAESESTDAGRQALISTVADLTGVEVDKYAEVGLLGFVLLTNAIGGVDVCLNESVDEPLSGAQFSAGTQTLDGPDALSFVRQRHDLPRGDLDRVVRQQVFMASLVGKALSTKTLSSPNALNELKNAIQRSVVISDGWDIIKFAEQLQDLAGGEVHFSTIPVITESGWSDDGQQSVVEVDPTAVRSWVSSLLAESSQNNSAENKTFDPATVSVEVANDSGIEGLALSVSTVLTTAGFGRGSVGNNTGPSVDTSRILAADPQSTQAQQVSIALAGLPVVADPTLPATVVRVVLATDYQGPTSAPINSAAPEVTAGPSLAAPPITAGTRGPQCVN
ncbi:MAG: LCP family protein [Mycobacteriaceae bacterium]